MKLPSFEPLCFTLSSEQCDNIDMTAAEKNNDLESFWWEEEG
jgi:hypothetical protein